MWGRAELVILPGHPKEHDRLDVCAAPQTHMGSSTPSWTVFGGQASGECLGLDEVMKVGPHDGIRALA